jgi:phytoene synthase
MGRHGVTRDDVVSGRGGPGLRAVLADLRAVARRHLSLATTLLPTLPSAVRPAFRSLALVEPYLSRMERRGYDPFATPVELTRWRRLAALVRGV